MSGHSKWSTIKRKKEANDASRGKLFSRLSRAITIAVKTGGGINPETNHKLRIAIDAAREANMPKTNIEKILSKAESAGDMSEITYEGFGPGSVGILVEVATDNKNRSAQEIKQIFEKGGGIFASSGSVSFNFIPRGFFLVAKFDDIDTQMLEMIDMGVEEMDETDEGIEVYVDPKLFSETKTLLENKFRILSSELIMKPVSLVEIKDQKSVEKLIRLLDILEDHDDVQGVYNNADITVSLD